MHRITVEQFNLDIYKYGWIVDGDFIGTHYPCTFKCINCGNTRTIQTAKDIKRAKCKNCNQHICLYCNKEFFILPNNASTNRIFCYDCIPNTNTIEGRAKRSRLYNICISKIIKEKYGTFCSICGYDKCYEALDFHHINPIEKEYTASNLIKSHKDINIIFKELDKCILICANCHRELHANEKGEYIAS